MPTIRLKAGDFGSETDVTVGLGGIYLPDPARPGLRLSVDFEAIASIDSIADDRSEQVAAARDLAVSGFLKVGPLGLLNSVRAVGKVKQVIFEVRLKDGRSFRASADARVYVDLRSDWVTARGVLDVDPVDDASPGADAIIARYLRAGAVPSAPDAAPAMPSRANMAKALSPASETATPLPVPGSPTGVERRVLADRRAQPTFGRRRPTD